MLFGVANINAAAVFMPICADSALQIRHESGAYKNLVSSYFAGFAPVRKI